MSLTAFILFCLVLFFFDPHMPHFLDLCSRSPLILPRAVTGSFSLWWMMVMACASGLLDVVAQLLNISKYFYRLTFAACPQQRDQQLIQCEAAFLITASTTMLRICPRKKTLNLPFPLSFYFAWSRQDIPFQDCSCIC